MYFWMGLPKYVFNKNADFALEDWPGSLAPRVPAVLPAFDRVTGSRLRSQEHVVGSLLSLCAPAWGLLPARTRHLLKDVWNRHCVARAIATAALRPHCCLHWAASLMSLTGKPQLLALSPTSECSTLVSLGQRAGWVWVSPSLMAIKG